MTNEVNLVTISTKNSETMNRTKNLLHTENSIILVSELISFMFRVFLILLKSSILFNDNEPNQVLKEHNW